MLAMDDQATYVTFKKDLSLLDNHGNWVHRDVNYLIRDIEAMIKADEPNARVMYGILLSLAAMGIFNAQVLSIFRRKKEIGTLMALGMTRKKVVGLFTMEGILNAVLASMVTLLFFGPILWFFGNYGIPLPLDYSDMGLIVAKRLFLFILLA